MTGERIDLRAIPRRGLRVRREAIARLVWDTDWYRSDDYRPDGVADLLDGLVNAETVIDFDFYLMELCELAERSGVEIVLRNLTRPIDLLR